MPLDPNEVGLTDPHAGPENVSPADPMTEWTGRRLLEQLALIASGGGGAALDAGFAFPTSFGVTGALFTSSDASGGGVVTDAPTSGKKLVLVDIEVSVDTTMRVDLVEEDGAVIASKFMAANSSFNFVTRAKRKLQTADKRLRVVTSAAGAIAVGVFYYSEA